MAADAQPGTPAGPAPVREAGAGAGDPAPGPGIEPRTAPDGADPAPTSAAPHWIAIAARAAAAAALAGFLLGAPYMLTAFALSALTLGLCNGLFAYGLDLAWGRAGMLSVGHAAFFGLGAYAVALSESRGIAVSVTLAVAAAAAAALALLVARIGLAAGADETRLILLTLGISLLLQKAATSFTEYTNGTNGLSVSSPGVVDAYYRTLLVVALVVAACTWLIVKARFGARLTAAAHNPDRAAQTGIDTVRTRSLAFAAGAVVSAVAGALYAYAAGLVSPPVFGLVMSTNVLVWLALGGRGSTAGPFLGAVVVTVSQQMLGSTWKSWYILALAALFVLAVQVAPGGLALLPRRLLARGRPETVLPRAIRKSPAKAAEPPPEAEHALVLDGVRKSFGPVDVLQGVDLTVDFGQCVCLIGPNGAGKSTLLAIVAGQLERDAGTIAILGHDAATAPVHRRVAMGVGRMFQIPSVFTALSPADNIRIARTAAPAPVELPEHYADLTGNDAIEAGILPLADRRRLELGMVLAGAPRLMLLDEPAAGLGRDDARRLTRELKETNRRTGCALLVVEHDMDIVRDIADHVVVLHGGRVIAQGTLDEVAADPAVRDAYLGAV